MLTVIVSVLLTLCGAEALLRIIDPMPTHEMFAMGVILDRRALFKIKGHSRPDINSLGYRDVEFRRDREHSQRVLVIGDSFVMGNNVSVDKTFPKLLESQFGGDVEVFNMGVVGYGPDQSYVRLIDEGLAFSPDTVILTVFPANDFRDLSKNNLFYVDTDNELAYNEDHPVAVAMPKLKLAMIGHRFLFGTYLDWNVESGLFSMMFDDQYGLIVDPNSPKSRAEIALMRVLLRKYQTLLQRENILFRVLIVPSYEYIQDDEWFREAGFAPESYFNNEKLLEEICRSEGIPVLNLTDRLLEVRQTSPFDPADHHLSVYGNEQVAIALKNWLSTDTGTD